MGGESSSTQQVNQTTQRSPYGPAEDALQGLLGAIPTPRGISGAETGALNQLQTQANLGNQYAPQIGNVATGLLGGGTDRTGVAQDAYNRYIQQTMPTAQGQYLDPNTNPFYGSLATDVTNRSRDAVNAAYAGSGRDPTGAGSFGGMLGESIARGLAPTYANQWNLERGNQMNAFTGQFGAGQSTAGLLGNLDAASRQAQLQGLGAADAATMAQNFGPLQTLQIEAQRRGISVKELADLFGITLPAAQAFGTDTMTGTQTGTQQMSGAQQFQTIASGIGNLGRLWGGGK